MREGEGLSRHRRGLGERAAEPALEAELAELLDAAVDDPELARFLEDEGRLVRVGDGLAIGTRRTTTRSEP